MKLSKYIDHTLLKADASNDQIIKLCKEAIEYDFMSVCINPSFIELAKQQLKNSDVLICTVIGFPLGQMTTESKVFETADAVKKGAQEVDMVINISKLKQRDDKYLIDEINAIKKACGSLVLKVIVETALLTDDEIAYAAQIISKTNADFIKTSTGFSTRGAILSDVVTFKANLTNGKKIKAAGGVRTHQDFLKFIETGADRIGTSSGIALLENKEVKSGY